MDPTEMSLKVLAEKVVKDSGQQFFNSYANIVSNVNANKGVLSKQPHANLVKKVPTRMERLYFYRYNLKNRGGLSSKGSIVKDVKKMLKDPIKKIMLQTFFITDAIEAVQDETDKRAEKEAAQAAGDAPPHWQAVGWAERAEVLNNYLPLEIAELDPYLYDDDMTKWVEKMEEAPILEEAF